ncbi:efflux RND transporter periplasmic adaptor subunit [Simplicispira lacusdiani]|uniref:efflux RND transporter periplasmic adaptor subunit n=1 Tax=Simplicispira lacusdiani TaxID=2213010 RepID=UPI000E753530|nr:efflux RND transporter periplasmic adaptor subunit [Simplicispira lacusdiani]
MLSRHPQTETVSALFPFSSGARWRLALASGSLGVALLLSACGKGDAPAAPPGGGMPPPEVGVVTVQPGELGLQTELPGRLEASRVAQVRARAAGILQQRLFQEGSDVKAGQVLFRIDAAPYEAALQSAEAALAKGQANLVQTTALAERYKPLAAANAVSQQEYANAVAAQKLAEADVAAGKAAVTTARINLGHASVTAPIAGRIGRALVTEGALVGQGEATQLAVVQQIHPMYVNFTQSAAEVMRLRRALEAGQFKRAAGGNAASVRVLLEDGSEYPLAGKLLFSDLSVDATTGQITLRAQVPNPDGLLLPGLYVRVRLEQAQAQQAILLPQQAVTRSAQGDTVLAIGADGKPAQRSIQIGGQQGGQWVVLGGLQAGEQVIVDGFQKLRGNPVVKPVPWQGGAKPGAPASGAPAAPASTASAAQ